MHKRMSVRAAVRIAAALTFAVAAATHPKLSYDASKNVVTSATLTLTGTGPIVQPPGNRPRGDCDDDDRRR